MKPLTPLQFEIDQVLRRIFGRIAVVLITLGTAAVVLSMMRINELGWSPNVILDIATYVGAVAVVALSRIIPLRLAAVLFLGIALFHAVANFYTHGLATIGGAIVVCAVILAGSFLGTRIALWLFGISLVAISVAGVLIANNIVVPDPNAIHYLEHPQAWIIHIVSIALYSSASLAAVLTIQEHLKRSLDRSNAQARELAERNQQFDLIARTMRDVLFIQDMHGAITYASPSVSTLFGYEPHELALFDASSFLTQESLERVKRDFGHYSELAHKGPVTVPLMEYEYVRKDGSVFWGEFRPDFLRNEVGTPIGCIAILRDISDRKIAQQERDLLAEELRQAEKMRAIGHLAGGVAHDFNNQLTGMMGFADLIRQITDNTVLREYAANIMAAGGRAADLTAKLLAFARKGKYRTEFVDMHAIVNETTGILSRSLDKTIEVRMRLCAKLSTLAGDTSQLQNALLNLGINARDAMPQGGVLTFATSNEPLPASKATKPPQTVEQFLCVRVTDSGTGMAPEVLEHLFEPFFTTKPPGKGTGMGLAAVYGTVELHGGKITVESQVGAGTTVALYLPAAHIGADDAAALDPVVVQQHAGVGTVLLIEDEDTVRLVSTRMLERLGYTVIGCRDGIDGVAKFYEMHDTLNLVMLDMVLPALSGVDVFNRIRAKHQTLKVLVCSGYSSDADVPELLDDPFTLFLHKPFTLDELGATLEQLKQTT